MKANSEKIVSLASVATTVAPSGAGAFRRSRKCTLRIPLAPSQNERQMNLTAIIIIMISVFSLFAGFGCAQKEMSKYQAKLPDTFILDPGGVKSIKILPLSKRKLYSKDLDIAVYPHSFIDADQTFYLNNDQLTSLMLTIANPKGRELSEAWIELVMPQGVEVVTTSYGMKYGVTKISWDSLGGKRAVKYTIPMHSLHPITIPRSPVKHKKQFAYSIRRMPLFWLKTSISPGEAPGTIRISMLFKEKGGKKIARTPYKSLKLKVIEKAQGAAPALTASAVFGRFTLACSDYEISKQVAIRELIKELGYNAVFGGYPIKMQGLDIWLQRGLQNAFEHGKNPKTLPEKYKFVTLGKEMPRLMCPSAIYQRSEWYMENIANPVYRQGVINRDARGFFHNLEPYVGYMRKGCFCERCKAEFIKNTGLDEKFVNAAWPNTILKKFPEQWREFRNWQAKKVVLTTNEDILSAAKQVQCKARLVLATTNDSIWGGENLRLDCSKWGDQDYDLTTWQYYWVPLIYRDFPYKDRTCAWQVGRSVGLKLDLDKRYGKNRKVRYGCMYGYEQAGPGFFTPEHLKFLHETAVFTGNKLIYNYPEWPIFDGRWALAISAANSRIKRWESEIQSSVLRCDHTREIVSPNPEINGKDPLPQDVNPQTILEFGNECKGRYLVTLEYVNKTRRVFPVANLWEYGECFFKLKPIVPPGKYVLREPEKNRIYQSPSGKEFWTTEELKKGALLHVGAVRWAIFTLQQNPPQKGKEVLITQKAMRDALAKSKSELEIITNKYAGNSRLKYKK